MKLLNRIMKKMASSDPTKSSLVVTVESLGSKRIIND